MEHTRTHVDVPPGSTYRLHVGDFSAELAAELDVTHADHDDVVIIRNPDDAAAAGRMNESTNH